MGQPTMKHELSLFIHVSLSQEMKVGGHDRPQNWTAFIKYTQKHFLCVVGTVLYDISPILK